MTERRSPHLSAVARVCPQVRHVGAEAGVAAHQKGNLSATFASVVVDLARYSYSCFRRSSTAPVARQKSGQTRMVRMPPLRKAFLCATRSCASCEPRSEAIEQRPR